LLLESFLGGISVDQISPLTPLTSSVPIPGGSVTVTSTSGTNGCWVVTTALSTGLLIVTCTMVGVAASASETASPTSDTSAASSLSVGPSPVSGRTSTSAAGASTTTRSGMLASVRVKGTPPGASLLQPAVVKPTKSAASAKPRRARLNVG